MLIAKNWKSYELLDAGDGEKLERWGEFYLRRPDPQAIWPKRLDSKKWENVHAHYHRSQKGGGHWEALKKLPSKWVINYNKLSFNVKLMSFKHTGLFPEQAENWEWMINKIKNAGRNINVLNLFAYTGAATVACAYAGASVCHVDASKGMVNWAKENLDLSGLADKPVRFIIEDVLEFVKREIRRGKKYEAIIMDPPSYGRGPNGEVWQIEEQLFLLIKEAFNLLADKPLFVLLNSYTTGFSPYVLRNIIDLNIKQKGIISCGEIGLPITNSNIILPCGIYCKWEENSIKN